MNKPLLLNILGPLDADALRILEEIPGIATERRRGADEQADIVVRAGDVTYAVDVKVRRDVNAATARQLIEHARHLPRRTGLLVVAGRTTQEARRLLEEAGVAVIDGLGNIRVQFPGVFVWVEGRVSDKGPAVAEPRVRLTGKAGVVAQALLSMPERRWNVHDLADTAGVSVGLAHRVLTRLEREELVAVEGRGPQRTRRVVNPTALLDLWAEEMQDRAVKQVRAFRLARDPEAQPRTLSRDLAKADIDHAVTGPAAATRLAPFITAVPVTDIWITGTVALADAVAAVHAETVPDGHNIVLRQAAGDAPLVFRKRIDDVWMANPFRLFHDLRQDQRRGREQADRLREEVIGF